MNEQVIRVGLTPRQAQVLSFLKAYYAEYGVYPTVREICKGKIDGKQVIKPMAAQSNAHRLLECLQKKGYILKEIASARGGGTALGQFKMGSVYEWTFPCLLRKST